MNITCDSCTEGSGPVGFYMEMVLLFLMALIKPGDICDCHNWKGRGKGIGV